MVQLQWGVEVKVKKTKLSRPTVSVKLHESEINDDLAEIGKVIWFDLIYGIFDISNN
ncbi:11412_t:CDS:2 [Entrophospora sp. SA101]|nr:11412_t:CDS:2 [Entrophospora sp. SA101]